MYTIENDIKEQKRNIAKATYQLNHLLACQYLINLENTAMVIPATYLASHYGCEEKKLFISGQIFNYSTPHAVKSVKSAISRHKSISGINRNPTWAALAIRYAKVADEYNLDAFLAKYDAENQ